MNRKGRSLISQGVYQFNSKEVKVNAKPLKSYNLQGFDIKSVQILVTTPGVPSLCSVFLATPTWKCKPCTALGGAVLFSVSPYESELSTVLRKTKPRNKSCGVCALSDHARIQTWNLLSRNQMRYSVAPRGRKSISLDRGLQIYFFLDLGQNNQALI